MAQEPQPEAMAEPPAQPLQPEQAIAALKQIIAEQLLQPQQQQIGLGIAAKQPAQQLLPPEEAIAALRQILAEQLLQPPPPQQPHAVAGAVAGLGGVAAVGAGVAATTAAYNIVASDNRCIAITVEVYNATKYILKSEGYFIAEGHVKIPPENIIPDSRQALVARKHNLTWTGASGMAVWRIGDTDRRLVVMWDVPFFTENKLSVGFRDGEVELDIGNYKAMHTDQLIVQAAVNPEIPAVNPEIQRNCNSYSKWVGVCRPVQVEREHCILKGNMGTESKCKATVEFIPLIKAEAATNYKEFF